MPRRTRQGKGSTTPSQEFGVGGPDLGGDDAAIDFDSGMPDRREAAQDEPLGRSRVSKRRTYSVGNFGEDHAMGAAGARYRESMDFEGGLRHSRDIVVKDEGGTPPVVDPPEDIEDETTKVDEPTVPGIPPVPTPPEISEPHKVTPPAKPVGLTKKADRFAVPEVLTWAAVRKGTMPAAGTSGLPASLEADVPPRYRYWKCTDQKAARLVRDALVEKQIFNEETCRVVDGLPRRAVYETVRKMFLPPVYENADPVVPAEVKAIEKAAGLLVDSDRDVTLFDENVTAAVGLDVILGRVGKIAGDWLIACRDSAEVRKAIDGPFFRLWSREDLIFLTNADLDDNESVEWVQHDRPAEVIKYALSEGRSIKLIKAAEERIVFGIVLEPDTVDAQNDTISADEIRQACHKFMEDFGNLGLQHKEIVNGRLKLLESFIAPVDFVVEKQEVKAGSWLMKERVVDDDLWAAVKKGAFTGYSIGGSAIRRPVK